MKQKNRDKKHFPLPLTFEEINNQWLTEALRVRFPGVTVEHSEIVDVNRGTCTKIRLRLQMDEAGRQAGIPETVILKGGFEKHSRDMYVTHQKEVNAYRDLYPRVELHTPRCFFADCDDIQLQGIVIIEDLVARGVSFCHPLVPQTNSQVARRLSALAQYHARTWNSPDLNPTGRWCWANEFVAAMGPYMAMFYDPQVWQELITSPRGAAVSVYFHDRQWVEQSLEKLIVFAGESTHCILHGDTHLGNLYEDTDGAPGFFDPQPHRGPSMVEVAYHIGAALDPADRRQWESALIKHYLEELCRHGVDAPEYDDAWQQYAAFLLIGYCIFLVNATDFQTEAVNTVYTARFSVAMVDNNTLEIIRNLPSPGSELQAQ